MVLLDFLTNANDKNYGYALAMHTGKFISSLHLTPEKVERY